MNYILIFLLALVCWPFVACVVNPDKEDPEDIVISVIVSGILAWAMVVVWGTIL